MIKHEKIQRLVYYLTFIVGFYMNGTNHLFFRNKVIGGIEYCLMI